MASGQFRSGAISIGEQPSRSGSVGTYWFRIGRREIRLDPGETIIGRDDTCHIVVTGALVSRRHALAVLDGTELSVEDLGSANGTFVNRARIHGRTPLQPGDSVSIGSCEIEVV